MASAKMIELALTTLQISSNSTLLTKRVKGVESTRDQFVWIGLVAYIPDDSIPIEIKRLVQSQSQFHDT